MTSLGSAAVVPSKPVFQQLRPPPPPPPPPQKSPPQPHPRLEPPSPQQVPRHLRNIEKWFDAIPERFRVSVRPAKLGKYLKDNFDNEQALTDAIAEVKRLTMQVTTLIPRRVRSHILRGPEGWEQSPPYASEGASEPSPAQGPASAPILRTAFSAPGMMTAPATTLAFPDSV